jgi:hypothetical protein
MKYYSIPAGIRKLKQISRQFDYKLVTKVVTKNGNNRIQFKRVGSKRAVL